MKNYAGIRCPRVGACVKERQFYRFDEQQPHQRGLATKLLRKFQSRSYEHFERDLVTESLKALDVVAREAYRFELRSCR